MISEQLKCKLQLNRDEFERNLYLSFISTRLLYVYGEYRAAFLREKSEQNEKAYAKLR